MTAKKCTKKRDGQSCHFANLTLLLSLQFSLTSQSLLLKFPNIQQRSLKQTKDDKPATKQ